MGKVNGCSKGIGLGKLHFITLNYTSYYTSYSKLFKCTFRTLNYNPSYIFHLDVKYAIN